MKHVYADGAYDTQAFYRVVEEKGGTPRKGATIDHKNAIRAITGMGGDTMGRKIWKILSGYHTRSLVESWISRFKRIFGGSLRSRKESHPDAELKYKAKIMNRFTELGMPISYAI